MSKLFKTSICIFLILLSVPLLAQKKFYDKHWSEVYQYELKDLPKSALKEVEIIYLKAKKDDDIPQTLKALIYQSKFINRLEEDAELIIEKNIKKEISNSTAPLRNLLEAMLAQIYWDYCKQNRGRLYQRSKLSEKVSNDFRTWDLSTLLLEIHTHFQNSLNNASTLQKVDLANIKEILIQSKNNRKYRPTLYDLLSHDALDFYKSEEILVNKPVKHFLLNDSTYFKHFETPVIPAIDTISSLMQTIKIYKDLLQFHKVSKDTTAIVDLELERLQFLVKKGSFTNVSKLHKKALAQLKSSYQNHSSSALVDYTFASIIMNEGSKREAFKICEKVINQFPDSEGGKNCAALKEAILLRRLHLTTENYIPVGKPTLIRVEYKNIDSINFTAYRIDYNFSDDFFTLENDSLKFARIGALQPAINWVSKLKKIGDHELHSTEIIAPDLPVGRYMIVAQLKPGKLVTRDLYAFHFMQVTNLVLTEVEGPNYQRFQVVDRNSGRPCKGASVSFKNPSSSVNETYETDKDGFFYLQKRSQSFNHLTAFVKYNEDSANFADFSFNARRDEIETEESFTAKTFLFTDRSIYRPGQKIYFKGILIKTRKSKSTVVNGEYVIVRLEDVNSDSVSSLRLKTNSFGSFSGEFQLPSTVLTGDFTLIAGEDEEDPHDFYLDLDDFESAEYEVSVEEYKRPTFEVTFEPVKESFKVGDSVKIKGVASAFNGSKLSNARVAYQVRRTVQYPAWYYWYHSRYSPVQEIAFEEVTSEKDGYFTVAFTDFGDESVDKEQRPVFHYEITADVTDITGETRSATTIVKVGYHTLTAKINGPDLINRRSTDNRVSITTENLNGEFVPAKGTFEVFKLHSTPNPVRTRPWVLPSERSIEESEFRKRFPHEIFDENADLKNWKKGTTAFKTSFNTASSKEIILPTTGKWELGGYLAELNTIDSAGNQIKDIFIFTISDPMSKSVPDNQLLVFMLDKPTYKVGDVARLKVGSAAEDITIVVDVEKNNKISKTYVESFSANLKEILIPVTENMGSGFAVIATATCYNSFISEKIVVQIISEAKKIEIETETFRDKIEPGGKETWSFIIKGKDHESQEAEVLASMYDSSLDQFKPHTWAFYPIPRDRYYSYFQPSANQSFGRLSFFIENEDHPRLNVYPHLYDKLDWFGFSLGNLGYVNRQYLERFYSSPIHSGKPSKVYRARSKEPAPGHIDGIITDSSGEPLLGVSILIKGTNKGTVTNADGEYTIEAKKGDILIYSFIGYSTAEALIDARNSINVRMEEDVLALAEVVVVGYGTQKKQNLTGAISTVTSNEVVGDVEVSYALQGRASGVSITGMPGGAAKLVIRGMATHENSPLPLYVVDGEIVASSKISQADIGDITVLKGSAATAIYGSRGANGVIIITTKSGQKKLDEEMAKINARKNFNETAFFFPRLVTNHEGRIRFTFTTPETLTRWKLQLLAHTRELVTQTKTLHAITQKELMVMPNAPRFLRIGDEIVLSVKISNLSAKSLNGKATLFLTDATNGASVDVAFNNQVRSQTFRIAEKENVEVSWKLKVPENCDALQYKLVAKAGNFSDGEQKVLPVLSNRMMVTETMPMYVRANQRKEFSLSKLRNQSSASLRHHQLTLEITSNPAWYGVQALPYLIEFPHECAEQTFSRYYANAIAGYVVNSDPKIKFVLDMWRGTGELTSTLEKNQELKSILIQETPWLRDAQDEVQQKKRLSLLFDLNNLKSQQESALTKLKDMQLSNGGFPWFKGGSWPNIAITQHIVAGVGHLIHLNIINENSPIHGIVVQALKYLDDEKLKQYEKLLDEAKKIRNKAQSDREGAVQERDYLIRHHLNFSDLQYLYMRSFYPNQVANGKLEEALRYYKSQSFLYWQSFPLYHKGMIALILHRDKNEKVAKEILASLKENSISSDELGMYWKENVAGWYWFESPIETQALLIEAFAEIESTDDGLSKDEKEKTLDDLRIWLLKNKQNNQWKSTKATTEAIYALLMNGTNWLALDDQVEVWVGDKTINMDSTQPEIGTGYYKTRWKAEDVKPEMGKVVLNKKSPGVAWGGLYWQYFEDLDKITEAETLLKLSKRVFKVTNTAEGEILNQVNENGRLLVGDLIRVRIELKAERDMEFLHMKDMRAAAFEPVDVLSGYKWQDGLGYYQSTKDASTNFFFDQLKKGIYVFEYDLRVNNKGNFSNGITTIQSMYAPEFSSHSEGMRVLVE